MSLELGQRLQVGALGTWEMELNEATGPERGKRRPGRGGAGGDGVMAEGNPGASRERREGAGALEARQGGGALLSPEMQMSLIRQA